MKSKSFHISLILKLKIAFSSFLFWLSSSLDPVSIFLNFLIIAKLTLRVRSLKVFLTNCSISIKCSLSNYTKNHGIDKAISKYRTTRKIHPKRDSSLDSWITLLPFLSLLWTNFDLESSFLYLPIWSQKRTFWSQWKCLPPSLCIGSFAQPF